MKELIMRAFSLVCAFLAAIYTLFWATLAWPAFVVWPSFGHFIHRAVGWGWCFFFGIHIRYVDLHKLPRSAVLAPNHESMFDIFVLAQLPRRIRWIAKKQVFQIPVLGWAMRTMGCYMVSRDKSGADIRVMQRLEEDLRKDEATVIIFPEGTRTRTGELLPFKKGAFKTAQNSGAYLVPIAMTGTFEICPAGKLPTRRGHKVVVRIGDPMHIAPGEKLELAMERYRQALTTLLAANKSLVS